MQSISREHLIGYRIIHTIKMGVYSVFTRSKFCEVPTIEYYKNANIQLLTYVEVDMKCYWAVNVILTDAERMSI